MPFLFLQILKRKNLGKAWYTLHKIFVMSKLNAIFSFKCLSSISFQNLVPLFGVGFSVLIYSITLFRKHRKREIVVKDIWIYPIKSCKGIKLSKCNITKTGFHLDREFMLITENMRFISQRAYPKMALINLYLDEDESILIASFIGKESIKIPLQLRPRTEWRLLKAEIWRDVCDCIDYGDEISSWFAGILQLPNLRLVRISPEFRRMTDPIYAPNGQVIVYVLYNYLSNMVTNNYIDSI